VHDYQWLVRSFTPQVVDGRAGGSGSGKLRIGAADVPAANPRVAVRLHGFEHRRPLWSSAFGYTLRHDTRFDVDC
jgi:hypothetical protein